MSRLTLPLVGMAIMLTALGGMIACQRSQDASLSTAALQVAEEPLTAEGLLADESSLLRLSIGKAGRPILVPVHVAGHGQISFLLDTGASVTVLDRSLKPEAATAVQSITLATATGIYLDVLYPCPNSKLGSLPLELDAIVYQDLEFLRLASGEDFYGILGLDFLQRWAIEIDYDQGVLQVWPTAPSSWTAQHAWPLTQRHKVWGLELTIGDDEREWFAVDTGANNSTIFAERFDDFVRRGAIAVPEVGLATTAASPSKANTGFVQSLSLGSFAFRDLRLDRADISLLGNHHLARFLVRLDFPAGRIYLQPSARFDLPERSATRGLSVLCRSGRKYVANIEPQGPAERAGLQTGDVLLRVNSQPAASWSMFDLRERFTSQPSIPITLEVQRGERRFETTLVTISKLNNVVR